MISGVAVLKLTWSPFGTLFLRGGRAGRYDDFAVAGLELVAVLGLELELPGLSTVPKTTAATGQRDAEVVST